MQELWLKGLTGEARETRKEAIKSYRNAFEALLEILEEEDIKPPDYDSPSWAYEQADQNGYNRAVKKIKKLITIKQD